MTKRRVHISLLLMLLAILAITVFQGYWLHKSYGEEQQNLHLRTNILFREMVYHMQTENMDKHPGIHFQVETIPEERSSGPAGERIRTKARDLNPDPYRGGAIRKKHPTDHLRVKKAIFLNRLADSISGMNNASSFGLVDSTRTREKGDTYDTAGVMKLMMEPAGDVKTIVIKPSGFPTVSVVGTARGLAARSYPRQGRNGEKDTAFFHLMAWSDSIRSALPIPTLTSRYAAILQKEKLDLPFVITKLEGLSASEETIELSIDQSSTSNRIAVGMINPYILQLDLLNPLPFLIRKLTPQITVSFLLIGLTVFSFILLYRNLMQQRKLTQLKNDLISNITHELRTPIATVSVAIEALKNFNALQDPLRTREYLDISGSELQRLSLLVDKVLKLSMFEKHQVELREESFDLRQVVEEVVSSMRLQFEKYGAQVHLHFTGDDFTIMADRLHITSVIFNLLDNALKYSKEDPVIRVDVAAHAGEIEISVKDNGIGISPGYLKKIFEKFFRIPSGDTHNVKGYGLGLSYVAYVVQRHQGKIQVESEPGIGSRFIIKLSGLA